jgi:Zn-dependent protease with chaperone function
MRVIVYVPLVVSALLAVAGPWSAGRMPPKLATRLLLVTGLASTVASIIALGLLTATLLGQVPSIAYVGAWSGEFLHHYDPVSPVIAELAGTAIIVLGVATTWTAVRWTRNLRRARRVSEGLRGDGRLVVLDRPEPEAFALPAGRDVSGRIVVSSGLLRMLDGAERRVVLAHEAAHLRHRHHRHRALAGLIAAANPLLVTLPGAIHHLTERWADEDAAAVVADRDIAARTLARAALATGAAHRRSPFDGVVQCFHRGGVPARVRALLADAPPRRPGAVLVLAVLLAGSLLSALEAGHDTAQLFDRASDHGLDVNEPSQVR